MSCTNNRFGRWVAAWAAGAALWACGATGAGEAWAQVAGVRVNGVDVSAGSGDGWSRAGDDVILQRNGMTYVVDGESSDGSVRIVIMGNCTMVASNLVLSGGTPVSVYNGYSPVLELAGTNAFSGAGNCAGLGVPEGRSITIRGDGALTATGGSWGAGIGGGAYTNAGSVTIEGGTVTAQAGISSAGIGGGYKGHGGTVAISGGTVSATGVSYGAGIGGGYQGKAGDVAISGGTVSATGGSGWGEGGAGIGSGTTAARGGSVVISGGTVTATGGGNSAGIGGGYRTMGCDVSIRGGLVVAKGTGDGAGIGGGGNTASYGSTAAIAISGGTVRPAAGGYGRDIGPGSSDSCEYRVTLSGGSVGTVADEIREAPTNSAGAAVWRVAVSGFAADEPVEGIAGLPAGYGTEGIVADGDGKVYLWLPDGSYRFKAVSDGEVRYVAAVVDGAAVETAAQDGMGLLVNGEDVAMGAGPGWSYDGAHLVVLSGSGPFAVTGAASGLCVRVAAACSVTASNLSLDVHAVDGLAALELGTGVSATLALAGTNVLRGGPQAAGLQVGDGRSLRIVDAAGQEPNAGRLEARGGNNAAGIGGGNGQGAGSIALAGGTIEAHGGTSGAAIGSGRSGQGGTVSVEDGALVEQAEGGSWAAGIGGGEYGTGPEVVISGGRILSAGAYSGACIGGGGRGTNAVVRISGGEVATGYGTSCSGIGGGRASVGTVVEISGGTVVAAGRQDGAGIGLAGLSRDCRVSISGGRVRATGGNDGGAGIGGASASTGLEISISGGTVVPAVRGTDPGNLVGFGRSHSYGATCGVEFTGGSVAAGAADVVPAATNRAGRTVWPVTVPLPEGTDTNAPVAFRALPAGYGTNGIYPDAEGKAYLWLPDGTYVFQAAGGVYRAEVAGAGTVAVPWVSGLEVNGVDIAALSGEGWTYDLGSRLELSGPGPFTVSGSISNVGMVAAADCAVTLSNALFDASAVNGVSAFALEGGRSVALTLAGTNELRGGDSAAGIRVPASDTLAIDGDGALSAAGGDYGAGIGGARAETSGAVTVSNGTVSATGGRDAAGIGGGSYGNGGSCTIAGGTVTAQGGGDGAGIGGGYLGAGGTIAISGGLVHATGGNYAPGLGGGSSGENATVTVTGGTVVPKGGNGAPFDVGLGYGSHSQGGPVEFTGGSVAVASAAVTNAPTGVGGARVWRVEVGGLPPGGELTAFTTPVGPTDIFRYGIHDIWADEDGKIYFWFPDGVYSFTVAVDGGSAVEYVARVAGADTVANVFVPVGLTVNGRDVAYLGGDGWWCDGGNSVFLTHNLSYTLSGTSEVYGVTALTGCRVTASNLYLHPRDRAAFQIGGNRVAVDLWSEGDGTNTFLSPYGYAGIAVCGSNNATLCVRGGAAPIEATSWRCGAGIGGNDGAGAGTITIEGGTIRATGSQGGAGIGGGPGGGAGSITIEGGTVEFASWRELDQGYESGAGIGGGRSGSGGSVMINGGTVTGTCGTGAAGIGGGYGGRDVYVCIQGGTVTVPKSAKDDTTGIGMGRNGRDCNVEIYGGTVEAHGSWLGAGIGGSTGCQGGSVTIYGGRITAVGGGRGPGIGPAFDGTMGVITILGGTVAATAGTSPADIGAGADGSGGVGGQASFVAFQGGNILAGPTNVIPAPKNVGLTPVWAVDVQLETWNADEKVSFYNFPQGYGTNDLYPSSNGLVRLWLPDGEYAFLANGRPYHATVADAPTTAEFWQTGFTVNGRDIAWFFGEGWNMDWNTRRVSLTNAMDYAVAGASTSFWVSAEADCAVSVRDVTIDLADAPFGPSPFAIAVNRTVALTLEGTNAFAAAEEGPAVKVPGSASAILSGSGSLSALGGGYAAGIGATPYDDAAGSITIAGGTIVATGGVFGAGIGGGQSCAGGTIAIEGGTVTATGGELAAGIGGGDTGAGGTIDIRGGSVTATGGELAAGIGGGDEGSGGSITISGGRVTATGGEGAAGIGGGGSGGSGEILISAGTVEATGGKAGPGIGTGLSGSGGSITISGGEVTATGGIETGAGIGGGYRSAGGTIAISGGEIAATGTGLGAGIGGGGQGAGGDITVSGGIVTARGGGGFESSGGGAGIGGGCDGDGGTVVISGGTVTATGGKFAAGIGGGERGTNGTVNITGGTVTAKGDAGGGAGIGGGENGGGGTILISGDANVTATGGLDAAGIGGGANGAATVTISGGTVTATGGGQGAGIGGGSGGTHGTVTVSGGTVTATAGSYGAGIGSGRNGYQWDITIANATVTATGGQRGAGIGGGREANYHNIGISSGTVTATGGDYAPGIGCGDSGGSDDSIVIEGGIIRATGGDHAADIGNSDDGRCRDIHVSGGTIYRTGDSPVRIGGAPYRRGSPVTFIGGAIYAALDTVTNAPYNTDDKRVFPAELDIGLLTNKVSSMDISVVATNSGYSIRYSYGDQDMYTDENGKLVIWLPSTGGMVYEITVRMEDGSVRYFCISIDAGGEVHIVDHLVVNGAFVLAGVDQRGSGWTYTNSTKQLTLTGNATVQGTSTNGGHRILVPAGGASSVALQGLTLAAQGSKYWSAITVSNTCTITVAGGMRTNWIAARGQYAAGIEVASNAVVTFDGDGILVAVGGKNAAGIGSRGGNAPCGKIEIRSGNVTGIGGEKAAGIGGGLSGNVQEGGILVKGGIVAGYGGANAAGIGAGYKPASPYLLVPDGAFRVDGGTVSACGDRTPAADSSSTGTQSWSDFVDSLGNVLPTMGDGQYKSTVITGGSVVPSRLHIVEPRPVDAESNLLYRVLMGGFEPFAEVDVSCDDLPDGYSTDGIVADANGLVCIWMAATNHAHLVVADGKYFTTPYPSTNATSLYPHDADFLDGGGSDVPPEDLPPSDPSDTNTLHRVTVPGLEPGAEVTLEIRAVTTNLVSTADSEGRYFFYVADGDYAFKANSLDYVVRVEGGPATAIRIDPSNPTGVTVDGTDVCAGMGPGWTYDMQSSNLVLSAGASVIAGSNTEGRVNATVAADMTLTASGLTLRAAVGKAAIALAPGVTATLALEGENALTGGSQHPAVEVPDGASVEILGDGSLVANGGSYAAGIGGAISQPVGTVAISGGTLDVTGGTYSAGIGSATDGTNGTIVVSGGSVTARAHGNAAAIGGGDRSVGGTVSITGGTVDASAYGAGAGIGGGNRSRLDSITIAGGTVTAQGGSDAAGIGGGRGGTVGTLTITDGTVTATGGTYAAAIGGGNIADGNDSTVELIAISGGTVTARTGSDAAAIGGGKGGYVGSISITGGTVDASAGSSGAGIGCGYGGTVDSVTVADGTVTAKGGTNAAGIGGGEGGGVGSIAISGGDIDATGGQQGAGIGGGKRFFGGEGGTVDTISVSGGNVVARGGEAAQDIGHERAEECGSTLFTGGSIHAMGGSVSPIPSNGTARVWCVTVPGLAPDTAVAGIAGLPDYNTDGIVADAAGQIYLWLPDGTHFFEIDGVPYGAFVDGADATAERIVPYGVLVDGHDVSELSGEGWTYDWGTRQLLLSGDSHVLAGSNTEGRVWVVLSNDMALTASDLVLASTNRPAIVLGSGVTATLSLSGETVLAGGDGRAAVEVPSGASLSIGGGGFLAATGGTNAAAIGGGDGGAAGTVAIAGGTVAAAGGTGAADIGAGANGTGGANLFTGGSIHALADAVTPAPSNGTARVWCVTFPGLPPDTAIASLTGLSGYGTEGLRTDASGNLYLWLPNGTYTGTVDGTAYWAQVEDAPTTARIDLPTGVCVDGTDVQAASGDGWSYDFMTGWLAISNNGHVVSGSNTDGRVAVSVTNGITLAVSNLTLAIGAETKQSALVVRPNSTATLLLQGDSSLRGGEYRPAVEVPLYATLTVAGTGTLAATGGYHAAAIGGRSMNTCGRIILSGGTILPVAGETAPAIGRGAQSYSGGFVHFTGGSIVVDRDAVVPAPSNTVGQAVWPVTVEGLTPGAAVALSVQPGSYGTDGIVADPTGKIVLWLPNGFYDLDVDGTAYVASVHDAGDIAEPSIGHVGVFADGIDLMYRHGANWSFTATNSELAVEGACTVSGSNTARNIYLRLADGADVTCSNLWITAGSTVTLARGDKATLRGIGFNSLKPLSEYAIWAVSGAQVTIESGTFRFSGYMASRPVIRGGSVNGSVFGNEHATDGTHDVWRVTVPGFAAYAPVALVGLPDTYDVSEIQADADGKIYLWLPDGTYDFTADGTEYLVRVAGAYATAETYTPRGVTVDGTDVGRLSGPGWTYDVNTKQLALSANCVLSGSNGVGAVSVLVSADCTVTLSNLFLRPSNTSAPYFPVLLGDGVSATLVLAGTNTLQGGYASAGIGVPTGAALSVAGDGILDASGGYVGAGIGGWNTTGCGTVSIEGGILLLGRGNEAACIGGGGRGDGGDVTISGGTVLLREYTSYPVPYSIGRGRNSSGTNGTLTITGGSLGELPRSTASHALSPNLLGSAPTNAAGEAVWSVTVTGLVANAETAFEGLPAYYGTNGIVADASGNVFLWLPDGSHAFRTGAREYTAEVAGAATVAVLAPLPVFTVTWLDDDGTGLATNEATLGDLPVYPGGTPAKEGDAQFSYAFAGWDPAPVAATTDAVYTATYTATTNEYLVTWSIDGADETEFYLYGETPSHADPAKDGDAQFSYTFAGWDPAIAEVTTNATYTAQFTERIHFYEVTWANDDGTPLATNFVAYGQTPAYTNDIPTKESDAQFTYTFADWTPEVVAVTTSATYTATYTVTTNAYEVTWSIDGATEPESYFYGETPSHATPAKDGDAQFSYTFAGWDPAIVEVTTNATYTAQFTTTTNSYTVTWSIDGVTETESYLYGATPSHATPAKEGDAQFTYTFAGWNPAITEVTTNATYTAQFTARTNFYEVTWANDDGTPLATNFVAYGQTPAYTNDIPAKEGDAQFTYTFADWTPEVVAVTTSATYTATYTATTNAYEVTWSIDGATETESYFYGETPSHADPTKEGNAQFTYTFAGWAPAIVDVTTNATYTARFTTTTNEYAVTWVNDDGTPLATNSVPYGETPVYGGETPTKDADGVNTYAFLGWTPAIAAVTNDATYTATYEATALPTGPTGVLVDGTDAAEGSGEGWTYDRASSNLVFAAAGTHAVCGTNTVGAVRLVADADIALAPTNLTLAGEGSLLGGTGSFAISGGTFVFGGDTACPVTVRGGSVHVTGTNVVVFSNGTERVYCVAVTNLSPGAAVALSGLPAYYGTEGIFADGEGTVYLWLPDGEWNPAASSSRTARARAAASVHTFFANGYEYTVALDPDAAPAEIFAVRGGALPLERMEITGFAVEGGMVRLDVAAEPATWMHGFAGTLAVRQSATLPFDETDGATLLDASATPRTLSSGGIATFTFPAAGTTGFFRIDKR